MNIDFLNGFADSTSANLYDLGPASSAQIFDYVWGRYTYPNGVPTDRCPEDVLGIGEYIYQTLIGAGVTRGIGGLSYWIKQMIDAQVGLLGRNNPNILFNKSTITEYTDNVTIRTYQVYFNYCKLLTSISIPFLQTVDSYIYIRRNPLLTYLNLGLTSGNLATSYNFANSVYIGLNASLASLDLSALKRAQDVVLDSNTSLASVDLSNLSTVSNQSSDRKSDGGFAFNRSFSGPAIVFYSNKLTSISIPALTSMVGPFTGGNLAVLNELDATSVSVPNLGGQIGNAYFFNLTSCTSINLSSLSSVYFNFMVVSCPAITGLFGINVTGMSFGGNFIVSNSCAGGGLALGTMDCRRVIIENTHLQILGGLTSCTGLRITGNDILANFTVNPQWIYTRDYNVITEVSLLGYTMPDDNEISDNALLNHITFSNLLGILDSFAFRRNPLLTYIRAVNCLYLGGHFGVSGNDVLDEITFTSLTEVNTDSAPGGNSVAAQSDGGFVIDDNPLLTTLNLPALVTVNGMFQVTRCPIFTAFTIPNFVPVNGQEMTFAFVNLNAATVNHILARLVANPDFVDGNIQFSIGTAVPSGQGIIDKATLIARGVRVVTQ